VYNIKIQVRGTILFLTQKIQVTEQLYSLNNATKVNLHLYLKLFSSYYWPVKNFCRKNWTYREFFV